MIRMIKIEVKQKQMAFILQSFGRHCDNDEWLINSQMTLLSQKSLDATQVVPRAILPESVNASHQLINCALIVWKVNVWLQTLNLSISADGFYEESYFLGAVGSNIR